MEEDLDCVRCGACCVSDYDAADYVHMTYDEAAVLRAAGKGLMIHVEDRQWGEPLPSLKTCYDKQENCRCIALRGKLGESVRCAIYDLRPEVCRKFKKGSGLCHEARRQAGLEFSDR